MKSLFILLYCCLLISCGNSDNKPKTTSSDKKESVSLATEKTPIVEPQEQQYIVNQDYDALKTPYDTEDSEHVIVYEFFGYACPHCFTFQPYMDALLASKPDYIKLIRVPLNFQPSWANLQQAYLTAEAMGIAEESHSQLFDAIHKQHKRFNSIGQLADWYAQEIGIDKADFLSTADSFILDSKQRKADKMGAQMQITSTPTLVVNGKYRASKRVKNRDEIMKVVNYLIEKEAKEMGLL